MPSGLVCIVCFFSTVSAERVYLTYEEMFCTTGCCDAISRFRYFIDIYAQTDTHTDGQHKIKTIAENANKPILKIMKKLKNTNEFICKPLKNAQNLMLKKHA